MHNRFFPAAAVLAAILTLAAPAASRAVIVTINGDDTNSAQFNRTTETGALSFQNPRFDAYQLTVSLSGAYNFNLVAGDPSTFDTYLHLYQGSFNPADPQTNFFRANDDGPGGTDAGSALSNVTLTAGTTYFLVADGFSAPDYGAYTATINGPGSIAAVLVPEPSTDALLVAAGCLGGLLLHRARRARAATPFAR